MEERVKEAFKSMKVKPPFVLETELVTYAPTDADVREVVLRLHQILEPRTIRALDDEAFAQRVRQVWELVRWIHTESSTPGRAVV